MASKIEKTIARLRQRIEEGAYYEAHQQLRVVATRYIKSENYDTAINILFNGAQDLLKAGQGASGGDLGIFMLDVYKKAETEVDGESKARIYQLVGNMNSDEPTRKKLIDNSVAWTMKNGEFPAGDPELHHFVGGIYAQDDEPYEAEKHLLLGTKESCQVFANLLYDWYLQDEVYTAPLYISRAVLGYLLLGNVRDAAKSLDVFTSRMLEDNPGGKLAVQSVETSSIDARIFPALPLLNFLRLACICVQRGQPGADLWQNLKSHYKNHIKEVGAWDEALEQIGEMYFGIQISRPRNLMADMMSSLFGGASGSPAAAPPPPAKKSVGPPKEPPSADLD